MHDVFAASRSGRNQNHSPNDGGSILRHLLRDHSPEREAKDITAGQTHPVQECQCVLRHPGDRPRYRPRGPPDASILEQNNLSPARKWVGDGRIPIIESASEVLQKKQGMFGAIAQPAIGISLLTHLQKFGYCVDVA
jgi:hypothetical protein